MRYAEVCVNSPAGRSKTFSYEAPDELEETPGQAEWVPFGDKVIQGIVIELAVAPQVEPVRPIIGLIEEPPVLSPNQLKLASWISDYYLCPLFDAVARSDRSRFRE